MRALPLSTTNLNPLRRRQAPLFAFRDTLPLGRPGDKAALESDLSTEPEAERSWELMRFPAFSSAKLSSVPLGRKALNSGVWGGAPESRSCWNADPFTSWVGDSSVRSYVPTSSVRHLSAFFEA